MRTRSLLLAVAALPVLVGSTLPAAAAPAPKPAAAPQELVYLSNHGDADLWTINADGSGRALLPKSNGAKTTSWNSTGKEWAPVFSPDGTWLAYQSDRTGSPDAVVRNVVSGEFRNLTKASTGTEYPGGWYLGSDGAPRLAYLSWPTGAGSDQLWSVRLDGSDRRMLVGSGLRIGGVAFRGSTAVLSAASGTEGRRLYTFDIPGSGSVPLSGMTPLNSVSGADDRDPTVDPTTGAVLFCRQGDDGVVRLFRQAAGASEPTLLLELGKILVNPEVSPDGTQLAFGSSPDGNNAHYDVYVAPLDVNGVGAARLIVGDPDFQDSNPTWSR